MEGMRETGCHGEKTTDISIATESHRRTHKSINKLEGTTGLRWFRVSPLRYLLISKRKMVTSHWRNPAGASVLHRRGQPPQKTYPCHASTMECTQKSPSVLQNSCQKCRASILSLKTVSGAQMEGEFTEPLARADPKEETRQEWRDVIG